jgi:hypothetical protein
MTSINGVNGSADFELDFVQLGTVRSEEGSPMTIIHPRDRKAQLLADGKTPMTITLLGRESEPFRRALRQIQLNRAELQQDRRAMGEEDLYGEDTDTLVACTIDWNIPKYEGQKPFPCTAVNIRKFWADRRFRWLRERALAFIIDDANFLPLASTASPDMPVISSDLPNHFPTVETSATQ